MGRAQGLLLSLALTGACDRDLLPGERILGDEVPAVVLDGTAGSRMGAAVAAGEVDGRVLVAVAAPGAERLWLFDAQGRLLDERQGPIAPSLAIAQGRVWTLRPGQGISSFVPGEEAVLERAQPGATDLALCPDGELRSVEDARAAVACGPEGQDLRSRCAEDETCAVLLDEVELDTTSPGSDLGFWEGLPCWGDARLDEGEAPGELRCQDGRSLQGAQGEHLGRSLAGGRVAGVFDKWLVPARARALRLDGGETWSVDRAAEGTDLVLAEGGGLLVLGVPGYAGPDPEQGRVFIVELDAGGSP